MSIWEKALATLTEFRSVCEDLSARRTPVQLVGLSHIHKALFAAGLMQTTKRRGVLLVGDEAEAARMIEDLQALGIRALPLPARELSLRQMESASREYEQMRLGTLAAMTEGGYDCVVACADAAIQYTIPPDTLLERTIELVAGAQLPVADLPAALHAAGYERCAQIEGPGQFAVRGGIVDVYPAACPYPVRMELWGDTIDTLGYFDLLTQRRTEALEAVAIPPAAEIMYDDAAALAADIAALAGAQRGKNAPLVKENLMRDADRLRGGAHPGSMDKYLPLIYPVKANLFTYMRDALLLVSEPARVRERVRTYLWQTEQDETALLEEGLLCRGLMEYAPTWEQVAPEMQKRPTVLMDAFSRGGIQLELKNMYAVDARQLPVWSGRVELLVEDLRDLLNRKTACVVLAGSEERAAVTLAEDLQKAGLPALYARSPLAPIRGQVLVLTGGISAGLEIPAANLAVLTHGRTVRPARRVRRRKEKGMEIHSLSELQIGDYVVHTVHGIGVYQGVHQVRVQGVVKDYIKLEYAKGDTLYVPVTQLDLVSKYIGNKEDATVRLHRLGGQEWQKAKTRVRTAVKDIAKQLVTLYSKRMSSPGFAFGPDEEWQYDFERHFPYEETEDQLRCVDEIKTDMEREVPMDRLLCGDVGFGKTEVALRAAFKCVSQSKQCAILVPTTILAFQHYNTILKRFEGFPVKVEMLSRFRTPKQQADIVRRVKSGEIDIIVGTHRLLSQDIAFRDLGLFIVDEEQRFGVAQKERIKELTPNVDVLTLSATPIPRTLNMAMSGIRDMSVIEEAPQDRRPVQTYVLEHDNGVIADAIRRELRRDGQVYYLHNRVDNIELTAAALRNRIPEARITVAHGKMNEEELSEIWRQVLEHEVDILVCTTIIETGVDIPNVNTLIIENADRYGLSQLHQLRGRVGRSSRRAYAYLTFTRGKELTDIATKRLETMRDFTEFGAGFKIAMRDMEIRGAGNLLGAQQHGHMEAVGYDMYLKLLADAVSEEKGETAAHSVECLVDLPISAHIPDEYISDNAQRLEIYRRIADIRTVEDSMDVFDELIDRFGEPPKAVQGLVDVALLRNMAAAIGVREIKQQQDSLLLYPDTLDMNVGGRLTAALPRRVMISAGNKPYYAVRIDRTGGKDALDTLREALEAVQEETT
ncbi:MAG: transcription-repair coupling factor [Clostridia bacterium]|nr:transcription-repair coupling factor [Clostridia bacterium]